MDYLKSNMDGAACGKVGPVGIGGVLRNHNGEVLYMFSKHVGVKYSDEAKFLAVLVALRIFRLSFHLILLVNVVSWTRTFRGP